MQAFWDGVKSNYESLVAAIATHPSAALWLGVSVLVATHIFRSMIG